MIVNDDRRLCLLKQSNQCTRDQFRSHFTCLFYYILQYFVFSSFNLFGEITILFLDILSCKYLQRLLKNVTSRLYSGLRSPQLTEKPNSLVEQLADQPTFI
jgi:hypothetical protein